MFSLLCVHISYGRGDASALEMMVCHMLSCALTNELASSINWAGKMVKEQSRQKKAFKDTF